MQSSTIGGKYENSVQDDMRESMSKFVDCIVFSTYGFVSLVLALGAGKCSFETKTWGSDNSCRAQDGKVSKVPLSRDLHCLNCFALLFQEVLFRKPDIC